MVRQGLPRRRPTCNRGIRYLPLELEGTHALATAQTLRQISYGTRMSGISRGKSFVFRVISNIE